MSQSHPTSKTVDFPKQLRALASHHAQYGFSNAQRAGLMASADEIERLQSQLATERDLGNAGELIERLTRDLRDLKDGDERIFDRLRAALSDFAAMPCETIGVEDMEPGCCRTCRARALLSGEPSPAPETSERPAHPLDGYCPGKRYIRSKLFQQFLEQDFWHAHHVDLVWRYNGEDVHEEADWLKDVWYALREPEDREPIAEGDARYYQAQSSEKASVCMGCNSTPCVCAELGSAQEAPACRSCGHVPAPGQQLTASGNCLVCEAL